MSFCNSKIMLIIIIAISILSCSGCKDRFEEGEKKGYAAGIEVGKKKGIAVGKKRGYREGYSEGKAEGFQQGVAKGKAEGFQQGVTEGKAEGFLQGEKKGIESGKKEGYLQGHSEGKAEGFLQGVTEGKAEGFQQGVTTGEVVGYKQGVSYGEAKGYNQGVRDGKAEGYQNGYQTAEKSIKKNFLIKIIKKYTLAVILLSLVVGVILMLLLKKFTEMYGSKIKSAFSRIVKELKSIFEKIFDYIFAVGNSVEPTIPTKLYCSNKKGHVNDPSNIFCTECAYPIIKSKSIKALLLISWWVITSITGYLVGTCKSNIPIYIYISFFIFVVLCLKLRYFYHNLKKLFLMYCVSFMLIFVIVFGRKSITSISFQIFMSFIVMWVIFNFIKTAYKNYKNGASNVDFFWMSTGVLFSFILYANVILRLFNTRLFLFGYYISEYKNILIPIQTTRVTILAICGLFILIKAFYNSFHVALKVPGVDILPIEYMDPKKDKFNNSILNFISRPIMFGWNASLKTANIICFSVVIFWRFLFRYTKCILSLLHYYFSNFIKVVWDFIKNFLYPLACKILLFILIYVLSGYVKEYIFVPTINDLLLTFLFITIITYVLMPLIILHNTKVNIGKAYSVYLMDSTYINVASLFIILFSSLTLSLLTLLDSKLPFKIKLISLTSGCSLLIFIMFVSIVLNNRNEKKARN